MREEMEITRQKTKRTGQSPGGREGGAMIPAGAGMGGIRMKLQYILCGALLLFCCTCISPVPASAPTVMISDYNVTPAVLMPGDTGTISFTIRTTDNNAKVQDTSGGTGSSTVKIQTTAINVFIDNIHVEGNGITVLSDDFDRVGDLGPGQSLPITVLIRAPDREGMYFPEVWIDTGTSFDVDGSSTRYPVPVNVNTRISLLKKPDLVLEKTLPSSVVPGTGFPVTLQLSNDGSGRADDLYVIINASLTALSLASPSNYHIDHLDPGENETFVLDFTSSKDSALGIRSVPVTLNYANADGTRESIRGEIGIPMKGNATIAIKSLTTDPIRPAAGDAITFVIRVENTGTDRATAVKAVLTTPLTGTKEAFIGSIDKDSDAPAIFYLKATSGGAIPVVVNLTYQDDYGTHALCENVTVTVNEPTGAGIAAVVLVLVAAAIGGVYWYLRYRRKGDHA
jgi:hypothetical protein